MYGTAHKTIPFSVILRLQTAFVNQRVSRRFPQIYDRGNNAKNTQTPLGVHYCHAVAFDAIQMGLMVCKNNTAALRELAVLTAWLLDAAERPPFNLREASELHTKITK